MIVLLTLILAPLTIFLVAGLVTSIRRRGWKAGVRQFGAAAVGLGAGVTQAVGRNSGADNWTGAALSGGLSENSVSEPTGNVVTDFLGGGEAVTEFTKVNDAELAYSSGEPPPSYFDDHYSAWHRHEEEDD